MILVVEVQRMYARPVVLELAGLHTKPVRSN